jgi:hypothetical protein
VTSMIEFAGEFEVMEDAEDGLDDLHEFGGAAAVSLASGARHVVVCG